MARRTAPTRSPKSFQKLSPSCLDNRPSPRPGHDHRRDHEQVERGGQEELPRISEDLVHGDPDEAPAYPRQEQEGGHGLEEEPQWPEPRLPRTAPRAQE